ncbi:MAG: hypothetical protein HY560_08885 [Gemmatimonadetes bacterium]|nr:hypothetical protein [Gemmatimonadota bacterium]
MVCALGLPATVTAQGARISGRVTRVDAADSVPLAGQWVVLHRLAAAGSGPVDSTRTDRAGRYVFLRPPTDTAARYLVGVTHGGVAYVTGAVALGRGSLTLDPVAVFDTSGTQPVVLVQRHTLVQRRNPDGSLPVLELLVLRNPGHRTRVAADSLHPAWRGLLLPGAQEVEVGESDVSVEAVWHSGDTIEVTAPIPPGEKQIVLTYLLSAAGRDLVIPADQPTGELDLMVADTTAQVVRGPLQALGIVSFENGRYLRLEGKDLSAGAPIVIRLASRPLAPGDLWWVIVAISALALIGGFVVWRRADLAGGGLTDAEWLAAQIAALDAAPSGGDAAARQRRRDELMARLSAALENRSRES